MRDFSGYLIVYERCFHDASKFFAKIQTMNSWIDENQPAEPKKQNNSPSETLRQYAQNAFDKTRIERKQRD